jgi:mRNA interferase RelE/StbE
MKIGRLATDPRPPGSSKMSGSDHYRIRQGDWRVVYAVDEKAKRVDILKIGHRREVYR